MTNYEDMELDELKQIAKDKGLSFGKIGKEKLIEKIKEMDEKSSTLASVMDDDDIADGKVAEESEPVEEVTPSSTLDSISSMIDDLEDSESEVIEESVELSNDYVVPVKSITYGGLIYKSRTTNAVFRWNAIGAVEYMRVDEINEMNNYKNDFLRKPLVILMDEKAIKKFRLTPVYENVAKINNLSSIFKQDEMTIRKTIRDAIDVNMRDILISKVRQMYKNKKLTDINVIRLLEDELKFDLTDAE